MFRVRGYNTRNKINVMEQVITWNGNRENREDCVFIRGKFYHKTKDCYLHEGIYYSPESRYYVLDHATGEMCLNINGQLDYGVVGVKNSELVFGYFSKDISKNGSIYVNPERAGKILKDIVLSHNPQNYHFEILEKTSKNFDMLKEAGIDKNNIFVKCMNVWAPLKFGYLSIKSTDSIIGADDATWYHSDINGMSTNTPYAFDLAYNSETMMDKFQESYEKSARTITDRENHLAGLLGDKTFGIEYESWDGRIPTYITASDGLIPLRDGSLRHDGVCGYEYASVIMSGARGLASIKAQCEHLKQFTTFNEKCSMHIHVGGIDRTPENLVKLWNGFTAIQKDFFRMFPSCLAQTSTYKQKDYCNMLPSLDKVGGVSAQTIVAFLSDGRDSLDRFGKKHPLDPSNQSKWNQNSRFK